MLSWEFQVLNLTSLVKGLQSNEIIVVQVSLVGRQDRAILLEFIEPSSLLGEDHSVLREHNEHSTIQGSEFSDDVLGEVLLVVSIRKEDAVVKVGLEIIGVSEVASWANVVLDYVEVNKVVCNVVNDVAENATLTVRDLSDSSVWASKGCKVSYFTLHWALLNNISGKKSSLRESKDIEFPLELRIIEHALAGSFSLALKVHEDGGNRSLSYFNAGSVCSSSSGNLLRKVFHSSMSA